MKSYTPNHSCIRLTKHREATSDWIAKKLEDNVKTNPDIPIDVMQDQLKKLYGIECDESRLFRARLRAKEGSQGSHALSYDKIPKYAEIIRQTNPGSLIKLACDRKSLTHQPNFKRLFFCLNSLRNGFLAGCRPFIGMDGCFLKGPFKGHLLTAVALDGNNGLFPFAFAVVESECKDSWSWFLTHLQTMIGSNRFTFMSDRQKGILSAIDDIVGKERCDI